MSIRAIRAERIRHAFGTVSAVSWLILLVHPVGATAQALSSSVTGAVKAHYFHSTKDLDDRSDLVGAGVWLKGSVRPGDDTVLKLEARGGNASPGRAGYGYADLIEAYVAHHRENWDFRLGKQVIAWGRADGINPTDVISPRDYTVLLPFDGDQRVGSWAAMATCDVSPTLAMSTVLRLSFEPSTIPLHRRAGFTYERDTPGGSTADLGWRLNRAGGDVDWSVTAFHGRSLLPAAGRDQPMDGAGLKLSYPLVTMLGADVARNFASFGTRLELAYTVPARSAARSEAGMRRNLYVVAGVDRTFFPRLNVNFQLFWRRNWGLADGSLPAHLSRANHFNASTFMQQRRNVTGATMRISNLWRQDTLQAEVFVQHFFMDGDTYLQPMISYEFSDSVKGTLGGQFYTGSGHQLSPLKKNQGVFSELRYSF